MTDKEMKANYPAAYNLMRKLYSLCLRATKKNVAPDSVMFAIENLLLLHISHYDDGGFSASLYRRKLKECHDEMYAYEVKGIQVN
jgi:hypothetical protein